MHITHRMARVLIAAVGIGCTPPPAQAPTPRAGFTATAGATGSHYLGCWRLITHEASRRGLRVDTAYVRLDSLVEAVSPTYVGLRALGYRHFGDDRRGVRVTWLVRPGVDSLHVSAGPLSGPAWEFSGRGDSLAGRASWHWDFGPRTDRGPAAAIRVTCSGAAARAV